METCGDQDQQKGHADHVHPAVPQQLQAAAQEGQREATGTASARTMPDQPRAGISTKD